MLNFNCLSFRQTESLGVKVRKFGESVEKERVVTSGKDATE